MVASTSKYKYIVCDPELCIGCQLCEYICSYTKNGEFNSYEDLKNNLKILRWLFMTLVDPLG